MSFRLDNLKQKVMWLYQAEMPGHDPWLRWLRACHLPFVANKAREVAIRVGANAELSEAAAWLHDIADTMMARSEEDHQAESLRLARQIMYECGYPEEDIATLVDDALPLHGCHGGKRPRSLEGKVLATADALAHLTTDFYLYALHDMATRKGLREVKDWTLEQAARDFNDKICFDEIREEARSNYEAIKKLFSSPSA